MYSDFARYRILVLASRARSRSSAVSRVRYVRVCGAASPTNSSERIERRGVSSDQPLTFSFRGHMKSASASRATAIPSAAAGSIFTRRSPASSMEAFMRIIASCSADGAAPAGSARPMASASAATVSRCFRRSSRVCTAPSRASMCTSSLEAGTDAAAGAAAAEPAFEEPPPPPRPCCPCCGAFAPRGAFASLRGAFGDASWRAALPLARCSRADRGAGAGSGAGAGAGAGAGSGSGSGSGSGWGSHSR